MDAEKIERINELARLSRDRELTKEEILEQTKLRREYLDTVRRNFKAQLDNIKMVDKK